MDRFEEAKLRVKEANDLVAWIESYLPLKPRGHRLLVALCPFHKESTPSFTVYADSQHYHCFGCGKSGDVFTFLMEREGLSFREAMERLADKAGIPLEGVFGSGAGERQKGPDPFQVLGEVRSFFQMTLQGADGEAARRYLAARGLEAAIEPWGLGCCPAVPGAVAAFAERRRLPLKVLEDAGVLRQNFVGRLIFPIEDERGRTVAFGARIVPGTVSAEKHGEFEPPKYVNSPESPFFSKRKLLFGLHRAKLAGNRRIVVMEGYTDVIASHLAAVTGAVATLGTAFTSEHARVVERYATDGLVLLFDGDRAGRQACERAMRELVNSRLVVRIALLTEAKDPGDFVVARPDEDPVVVDARRAQFRELLLHADDALTVWFRLLRQRLDLSQAANVEQVARECANLLALVDGEVRQQALLEQMARHLGMPAAALARQVRARPGARGNGAGADQNGQPVAAPPPPLTPGQRAEVELLACVVAAPQLAAEADAQSWSLAAVGELVALARDGVLLGRTTRAELLRYLFARVGERSDLQALLASAAARADGLTAPADYFASLQRGRQSLSARAEVRGTRQRLQAALAAGDRTTADELTRALVAQLRQERARAP